GVDREPPDHLAALRVEEDDSTLAVNGDGGEWSLADPGDALGLLADGDLVKDLALLDGNDADSAVVGVGDEEPAAIGRDVEQAVGASREGRSGHRQGKEQSEREAVRTESHV